MLTRRQLLTAAVAAPLAKFCKTEPVRPYAMIGTPIVLANGTIVRFYATRDKKPDSYKIDTRAWDRMWAEDMANCDSRYLDHFKKRI